MSGLPSGQRSLPPSQTWSAQPALEADASLCSSQRFVFVSTRHQQVSKLSFSLKLLCFVCRCERTRLGADAVRGPGDDSGSPPRGAAPPPTARHREQRRRLLHAAGHSGSQLETKRRRGLALALAHTGHALPVQLALPSCHTHTRGGGQLAAVAAAALRVAGDSAQRGPIGQRGSGNRRRCSAGALPRATRSSTG